MTFYNWKHPLFTRPRCFHLITLALVSDARPDIMEEDRTSGNQSLEQQSDDLHSEWVDGIFHDNCVLIFLSSLIVIYKSPFSFSFFEICGSFIVDSSPILVSIYLTSVSKVIQLKPFYCEFRNTSAICISGVPSRRAIPNRISRDVSTHIYLAGWNNICWYEILLIKYPLTRIRQPWLRCAKLTIISDLIQERVLLIVRLCKPSVFMKCMLSVIRHNTSPGP